MNKYTAKKSAVILSVIYMLLFIWIFNSNNVEAALPADSEPHFGDVNNDGTADKKDIILLQHYLTKQNPSGINLTAADIDGDNRINVFDLIYLKRYIIYGTYPKGKTPVVTTAVSTAAVTTSSTASSEPIEKTYASAVLKLVNKERAKVGSPPLVLNDKLCSVAMIRADEISELFSHTRPDGQSCFTAVEEADIDYSYVGENIAAGSPTPESVMDVWINSKGHYENIINPEFEEFGLGYVYAPNASYRYYWVQIFIEK